MTVNDQHIAKIPALLRGLRDAGLRSAVVYSEVDRRGLPVLLADEVVVELEVDDAVRWQVDLELTDIETNEKVWIGGKKHKKYIGRSNFKG